MCRVILYCRVSTDEQSEGCSLEIQERFLRAYCNNRGDDVIGIYREDYSAKGHELNRPEFKKMYDYCRKHRNEVDKVLFLRWDRFSRNVEFAFAYKRKFIDEMQVEINSIESPIDFKSGDWATLLGLFCGTAHSEDVKISKRTKDGIHGTLLKGKWSGRAPRGYRNVRRAKHDCWVEIDERLAGTITQLFVEVAKGLEAPTLIKRRLYPQLADSTFFEMMRNPFYAGLVRVPAYEGDPEQIVQGQHEPLIDKITFDEVQNVIDGKKKDTPKLHKPINPDLYLRRFLTCPVCGHVLTGATSKGNGGLYTYYMCSNDHKHFSARAEEVNEMFVKYVSKLKPNRAVLELYNEILLDIRGDRVKDNQEQAKRLEEQQNALKERINRVNDLFFEGDITKVDRDQNIARYQSDVDRLQTQINALRLSEDMKIKDKLNYSINLIGNLGEFFTSATPEVKIKLLGSIFPEKIEFDGKNYRTKSYNKLLDVIYQETKQLQGRGKKKSPKNEGDFGLVPRAGVEPARL